LDKRSSVSVYRRIRRSIECFHSVVALTRAARFLSLCAVGGLLVVSGVSADVAEPGANNVSRLDAKVYARAERFLPWNADKYARNSNVDHQWIGTTDTFWYARRTETGKEFVIVDAASGKRRAAFDHALLARALSAALGKPVDPQNLPFERFELLDGGRSGALGVSIENKDWRCNLSQSRCDAEASASNPAHVVSPDGKWAAFLKDHNVWLRSLRDQTERPLTRDGEEHYGYGTFPGTGGAMGLRPAQQRSPTVLWSPDSSKLLTHRLDEREVLDMHLLEMAPANGVRPVLHSFRYALPGDAHKPSQQLVIADVASGELTQMKHEPLAVTYVDSILDDRVWWSEDSDTVYVIPREEGQQRVQLLAVNAGTGETRQLIEEDGKTYVEIGPTVAERAVTTLPDGRILWYSERSDWGHLYLYDRNGQLIRPLTSGAWKVGSVVRIDMQHARVYFTAAGREAGEDPYQQHLYVVNLDGSALRLLTPENADHEIRLAAPEIYRNLMPGMPDSSKESFSPSGRYFVETYSRPDLASVTVLRTAAGRLITTLEHADTSALQVEGLRLPEPFSALAADGHTKVYGTIYRPSHFDPQRKYPIIDVIYGGPQHIITAKTFRGALFGAYYTPQALAELGFIVINIDGRGTPSRSKSFHDESYGNLAQAGGLEDHIAGIRQLAARYPYIDLERVGITGGSGGGFASTRAILAYPDFFKVAVSMAGNHDQRGYLLAWGPTYQGPYQGANYDAQINARLAANLKGKLFLIHGDMDDNVHPALTVQVADALIKANKDFDFLLMPGFDHRSMLGPTSTYVQRRLWDYFVRHLLGAEPPEDYKISGPSP
jgi:dipeptidyl-peptidase 4